MIEKISDREQREHQSARRKGVAPSTSLRRHFIALARQVRTWWSSQTDCPSRDMRIGVSSLSPGAGRSTVSFNLAASISSLTKESVLLLESDFGKHYITRRLGYARAAGLSELIAGETSFEEAVHPTPISHLSVLGCGQLSDQEALELQFERLPELLDEHATRFGSVVFDLPVASHLTAFHSIVPHLDGVVLTVESKQIDQREISRFRRQLESSGVPIVGLVINKS